MIFIAANTYSDNRIPLTMLPIILIKIAAYGCHAFIKRQIGSYMFLKKHFVFFDYTEPLVFFMLDYITVMGLFIIVGYYFSMFLRKKS